MKPVVSIIMATYNRAHFIEETLQSIRNQEFKNFECLIIDDGGTDNTLEVITPILKEDNRFSFQKRPNKYQKGLPGCRNYGIDLSKGDYIIFFDDDDIVHPQNLELCVEELSKRDVSFCRYNRNVFTDKFDYDFDLSKKYESFYIHTKDIEALLKNELPFNSCAVMWKAECFQKNRFIETLMYAEEWELYSRILSTGIRGISIEKCLFYGRKHPNSNTGEYGRRDFIRLESKKNAILLIVENLKSKQLLSKSLIKYFIASSLKFSDFNLFSDIIKTLQLNFFQKTYWKFYYQTLPFRIANTRLLKRLKIK